MNSQQRPRIIESTVLRTFSCADNPLDIFDGFASVGGSRIRSHRRWYGQGPGKIGEYLNSRVIVGGRDIDYGDDPRVFVHQGKLCVVASMYSDEHGFRSHLVEFSAPDRWQRYFLMAPPRLSPGKNWSPFESQDGRLNFIHSFSPLIVLTEIRREGGILLLRARESAGITPQEGDASGFPAHRGGTNGVAFGNLIVGIGHTTRKASKADGSPVIIPGCLYPDDRQLIHRPFIWRLDLDAMTIDAAEFDHKWDPRFWIVDPTSLTFDRNSGEIEFFTTEVERNYIDPTGAGRSMRYKVELFNSGAIS